MKIHVSSLAKVYDVTADENPSHVISLLGPGTEFPDFSEHADVAHHCVELDDIRKPIDGYLTPNGEHVLNLIKFLKSWDPEKPLLAHCWAGISRSSVTALIAGCIKNPDIEEARIASAIAEASPTAYPNTLIAALADDILERDGRLAAAARYICADEQRIVKIRTIEEAAPFSIPAKFEHL